MSERIRIGPYPSQKLGEAVERLLERIDGRRVVKGLTSDALPGTRAELSPHGLVRVIESYDIQRDINVYGLEVLVESLSAVDRAEPLEPETPVTAGVAGSSSASPQAPANSGAGSVTAGSSNAGEARRISKTDVLGS